jgi:hypothetical protein
MLITVLLATNLVAQKNCWFSLFNKSRFDF